MTEHVPTRQTLSYLTDRLGGDIQVASIHIYMLDWPAPKIIDTFIPAVGSHSAADSLNQDQFGFQASKHCAPQAPLMAMQVVTLFICLASASDGRCGPIRETAIYAG